MMIPLTQAEQTSLLRLCNSGKTQQRLALRANILLELAQGLPVVTTAKRLKITPKTLRKWRDRWLEAAERLSEVQNQPDEALEPLILEVRCPTLWKTRRVHPGGDYPDPSALV